MGIAILRLIAWKNTKKPFFFRKQGLHTKRFYGTISFCENSGNQRSSDRTHVHPCSEWTSQRCQTHSWLRWPALHLSRIPAYYIKHTLVLRAWKPRSRFQCQRPPLKSGRRLKPGFETGQPSRSFDRRLWRMCPLSTRWRKPIHPSRSVSTCF